MHLFSLLNSAARRFPSNAAIYIGDRPVCTFEELRARALGIGGYLRQRFGSGAKIGIMSENCPEYVEILFGIWAAGCTAVPINFKLHPREVGDLAADAAIKLLLASDKCLKALQVDLSLDQCACPTLEIASNEYRHCIETGSPCTVSGGGVELAWLFYTSGTTGRSKGAMLSHRNLLAMTVAHLADIESADESGHLIHAAPMSHGSGLYILPYLSRATAQVIPSSRGFDPDEFLDLSARFARNSSFLAPTMIRRLRESALARDHRPANLRTILYGGGPMYVEDLKKSLEVFGPVFINIYGQGETPMTISSLRREDHVGAADMILGSVGWPRSTIEVAIVDDVGQLCEVGQSGEIICRGDTVMSGYWNNPLATAEAIRDGWLYTGDVGSFDDRGYLTLRDRSKDLIISGGSNIYPREVEEILLACPGVIETCVVGEIDAEWGESVVAFIVTDGQTALTDADLDSHCLEHIARFKRPKRYIRMASLPKNSYGKILRRELRSHLTSVEGHV